jgi:hypothetical protein
MGDFTPLESCDAQVAGQFAGPIDRDSGFLDNDVRTGLLLSQGVAENSFKSPASAADVTRNGRGISLYLPLKTPHDETNGIQDAVGDFVDVAAEGFMWVRTEETIALGDAVYARHTAKGANTILGNFRNDGDPNVATVTVGGTWAENETATVQVTVTKGGVASVLPACTATGDAAPTVDEMGAALNAALVLQEANGFDVVYSASTDTLVFTPRTDVDSITVAVSEASSAGTITVDDGTVENTCALVPNASWRSACTGASIAKLEVNFP